MTSTDSFDYEVKTEDIYKEIEVPNECVSEPIGIDKNKVDCFWWVGEKHNWGVVDSKIVGKIQMEFLTSR